jgi:hypothetical protein
MTTMDQIPYGEQRDNNQIVKENNRVNEKLKEMNDANIQWFKMQRAVSTPLYIIFNRFLAIILTHQTVTEL